MGTLSPIDYPADKISRLIHDGVIPPPSFDLNFTKKGNARFHREPTVIYSGGANGTFFDSAGVLQTSGTDAARFDHDPVTLTPLGLLIEEERTNLALHSESFSFPWVGSGTPGLISNNSVAPDGTTTMDRVNDEDTNSLPGIQQGQTFPATNLPYTYSLYVQKFVQSTFPELQIDMTGGTRTRGAVQLDTETGATFIRNLNGAPGTTTAVQELKDHWRVSLTVNNAGGNTTLTIRLNAAMSATFGAQEKSVLGGVNIWGHMLEQGSFATSYIKTTTAAVLRSDDLATITGTDFSNFFNSLEGTLLVVWRTPNSISGKFTRLVQFDDGTKNNRIGLLKNAGGALRFGVQRIGSSEAAPEIGGGWNTGVEQKAIVRWGLNDFAISLNGSAPLFDTLGTIPTVDRMSIGRNSTGGLHLNGHIARIIYWPTRLPNALLQSLTV